MTIITPEDCTFSASADFLRGQPSGKICFEKRLEQEGFPWGHPGIFTLRNGYAVVHNDSGKIFLISRNFKITRTIEIGYENPGIIAVAQQGAEIIALDASFDQVRLLKLGKEGFTEIGVQEPEYPLPPTNLLQDEVGLMVEYGAGEYLDRVALTSQGLSLKPAKHYIFNGKAYFFEQTETSTYSHSRQLHLGEKTIEIKTPNHLGSLRFLGLNGQGEIYVLVEDVALLPIITVEQSIWQISPTGEILSIAKISEPKKTLGQTHAVTLDLEGGLLVFVLKGKVFEFWHPLRTYRQTLLKRDQNPLPRDQLFRKITRVPKKQELTVYTGECLTEAQIQQNINSYLAVKTWIPREAIENELGFNPRKQPAYLKGAGEYSSVSYSWGGNDTPSDFVKAMKTAPKHPAYYKAGNLALKVLRDTYGVDCSGFVGRVLGLGRKYSTRSLAEWGEPLTFETLNKTGFIKGDILIKPGYHVTLIASIVRNGILNYESTHSRRQDRVVHSFQPWGMINGFSLLRPKLLCPVR